MLHTDIYNIAIRLRAEACTVFNPFAAARLIRLADALEEASQRAWYLEECPVPIAARDPVSVGGNVVLFKPMVRVVNGPNSAA